MRLRLQQLRQLGDIRRDPPRVVFGEEPPCNVLLILVVVSLWLAFLRREF
jgi:hypothetical protein